MNSKIQLFIIIGLHWSLVILFFTVYLFSFWFYELKTPFFVLVALTTLSWLPHKDCPLLTWENNLRKKIEGENFVPRRFFYLMNAIQRLIGKPLPS